MDAAKKNYCHRLDVQVIYECQALGKWHKCKWYEPEDPEDSLFCKHYGGNNSTVILGCQHPMARRDAENAGI